MQMFEVWVSSMEQEGLFPTQFDQPVSSGDWCTSLSLLLVQNKGIKQVAGTTISEGGVDINSYMMLGQRQIKSRWLQVRILPEIQPYFINKSDEYEPHLLALLGELRNSQEFPH